MEKVKESESEAKPAKTSGSQPNAAEASVLKWEVFVTPGIPVVVRDKPPGVRETY